MSLWEFLRVTIGSCVFCADGIMITNNSNNNYVFLNVFMFRITSMTLMNINPQKEIFHHNDFPVPVYTTSKYRDPKLGESPITFWQFPSQGGWFGILWNNIQAVLIFDPTINLWGHFQVPDFKISKVASLASACFSVWTCWKVRNSNKIATICDFQAYSCNSPTEMRVKHFKGVLHPRPVFGLFLHFFQKLQHIGNK